MRVKRQVARELIGACGDGRTLSSQAGSSPSHVWRSVPRSWTDTTSSGTSPTLRKPCGVSGGTTSIPSGSSSTVSSPRVQRPRPARSRKVSAYGWTWSSTARPGGVRVTKIEMSTPARGKPSKRKAVGPRARSESSSVTARGRSMRQPGARPNPRCPRGRSGTSAIPERLPAARRAPARGGTRRRSSRRRSRCRRPAARPGRARRSPPRRG